MKVWDTPEVMGRVRELYESGLAARELEPIFGVSHNTVLAAMKRHGIPRRAARLRRPTVFVGERYGQLEVLAHDSTRDGSGRYYRCRCDCGNETVVCGAKLTSGHTRSCGCLHIEVRAAAVAAVAERQRAKGQRSFARVREAAMRRRRFTVADIMDETGLSNSRVSELLHRLEATGAVAPPVYEWNFQKPGEAAPTAARRTAKTTKPKNFSGGGTSGRMKLPPTKELRVVAQKYGVECRALPNGHYELTLANGQTVQLASTPKNPSGAARAAVAEIERKSKS